MVRGLGKSELAVLSAYLIWYLIKGHGLMTDEPPFQCPRCRESSAIGGMNQIVGQ